MILIQYFKQELIQVLITEWVPHIYFIILENETIRTHKNVFWEIMKKKLDLNFGETREVE